MSMCYPFQLPDLPYDYKALAPAIGEDTLHYHHDKHFKTYVDNLNKAMADLPGFQQKTLEEILRTLEEIPEAQRTAVRNNGGGVYNHALYFECLAANGGGAPSGALADAINQSFGSFESFQKQMKEAALGQFGSGYAFLAADQSGKLSIVKTANQDSPLTNGLYPLLCVDVWEHAYYLDYQNLRGDYVDKWFSVVSWEKVESRYQTCQGK